MLPYRTPRHRHLSSFALPLLIVCLTQSTLLAQTEIKRQVDAEAGGTVEIENIAGSVTITGWDHHRIEVTGVLSRGVEDLEIETRSRRVEIEVDQGSRHAGSAELEIRLPKGSRVRIDTVSADVHISGVDGTIEVESVSGSVDVEGRPASVDVETVSGSIDIESVVTRARIETVAGRVRLHGGREIEIATVSGSIQLEDMNQVERVDLEAVSGSIDFAGSLAKRGEISISSHNGSIDIALPATTSARFKVSSFSGRIDNELGPPAKRERFSPSREVEFSIGSGDAQVRIESFSGGVALRKH